MRSQHARLAALSKSAQSPSGAATTERARRVFLESFDTRHECRLCGVVEIDQSLPEKERKRMSTAAYKAHQTRVSHRQRVLRERAKSALAEAETLADAV